MVKVERYGLYNLGAEGAKAKLAAVISPDDMNEASDMVLVAPLFSKVTGAPYRPAIVFKGKDGEVAMDRLISVDKEMLKKKVGTLPPELAEEMMSILSEMFK